MKAVVLAAGKGSRLRPLTNRRPKPMLPVGNKPLLESVIESVARAGVDEIVLIVGYHRERIQNHFGNGDRWNVDISYAVQEKQLGTGHALLQAESHIDSDFIALNGDRYFEPTVVEDLIDERRQTGKSCLAVTRVETPNRFGVVELNGQTVTNIVEKPSPGSIMSEQINAGVYAFGPDIFSAIRQTDGHDEPALTTTLQTRSEIHPVRAIRYDGFWGDVSYPWDLLWLNSYILDQHRSTRESESHQSAHIAVSAIVHDGVVLEKGATIQPGAAVLRGTAIGKNATVGVNAVIEDAVIFPDATIGAGAVVRDCIVGANATIGPNTTIEGGSTDLILDDNIHHDVNFGGIVGDNAHLGGNVVVTPGTIIGESVTADSGTVVNGQIEDNALVQRG